MAKVYLETSFFSACVSTRTSVKIVGWRLRSLEWWNNERHKYDLYVSAEVVRELSSKQFKNREGAIGMLQGLTILEITQEAYELSEHLVREKVMPGPAAEGDAIHVSLAILNRLEYILSWNVNHLANSGKVKHLSVVCKRLGLTAPRIVTPDKLLGG